MKKILIIVGVLALVLASAIMLGARFDKEATKREMEKLEIDRLAEEEKAANDWAFGKRLRAKVDTALQYAEDNNFDRDHIILIDFSLHSGKNRLFVWDHKGDIVTHSGLCAHGMGTDDNRSTYTDIKFSNAEGSYCSSLGKYKIGVRSYSNWGINVHYKLHGLENTNDNAYKRIVVLHSHTPIPDDEIFPKHLPLGYSQGCPVVSDALMKELDALMKYKNKPVLLWIYD